MTIIAMFASRIFKQYKWIAQVLSGTKWDINEDVAKSQNLNERISFREY